MVNNCLQGLVFTAHNIMELSKIRLRNFKANLSYININDKINTLFELFEEQIESKSLKTLNNCSEVLANH